MRFGLAVPLYFAAPVAGAVAFILWFYRVHRNLRPLGKHDLEYSPGWAIRRMVHPDRQSLHPLPDHVRGLEGSDPERLPGPTPHHAASLSLVPDGGLVPADAFHRRGLQRFDQKDLAG